MVKRKKLFVALVIVFIVVSIPSILVYLRSSIYSYSTKIDYDYHFSKTDAEIIDLDIVDNAFEIPSNLRPHKSVFLKVHLNTNFWGIFFQPSLKIKVGNTQITAYVEHVTEGVRYLNISSLPLTGGAELQFESNRIEISDQAAKLIVFDNVDVMGSTILVIAPHPDDAEIAAYGLYSSNPDSFIVTVTAGDAGGFGYDERFSDLVEHSRKKGQLRTWNSITVPLLAGIPPEQVLNLGFFDGTLKKLHSQNPDTVQSIYAGLSDVNFFRKQNISSLSEGLTGGSDWNSLVENFEYLLKIIKPDVIVTPYPALDAHSDHKYSTIALIEAIKNLELRNGYLFLYSNHYEGNVYYPYGEMGGVISLPPNFNDDIYFKSIYSHPLTLSTQIDKLFALEAMNDLRLDTEWLTSFGAIKKMISILRKNALGAEYSFFRKAVRSNELFFVIDVEDLYQEHKLERILDDG